MPFNLKAIAILMLATMLGLGMPLSHASAEEESTLKADATPKAEGAPKGEEGEKKKDSKVADITGGRFTGDPIYVHIDPMILPVITDRGVEQLVTILMDIEVKDFDVADSLHTQMPRVRDALMRALYGGLGQGSLRSGKLADVTKIKAKASNAVAEVVGPGNVRDVLIQGVAQRMM